MALRKFFELVKRGFHKVRPKLENHSEEAERQNKRIMLEEVLAEFKKARRGGDGDLHLVRLSEESLEHIESFLKSELKGIEYAEFLKSLPTVPYQPLTGKSQ